MRNLILGEEPDCVTKLFSFLNVSEICQAELVCTSWRCMIVEYMVWRQKLAQKWHSNPFWRQSLQQHDWNRYEPSHEANKRLCLEIAITIPDEITDSLIRYVRKESNLNDAHLSKCFTTSIERSFVERLVNDKNKIISKIPKRPWGRIGWRRGPRRIVFRMNMIHPFLGDDNPDLIHAFSKLILFSPSAFPILVSKLNRQDVIMAGARYGKGRIIVAAHHKMLNNEALMQVHFHGCN